VGTFFIPKKGINNTEECEEGEFLLKMKERRPAETRIEASRGRAGGWRPESAGGGGA
jgi:hypothetical protein